MGYKIKEVREDRRLTQEELSAKSGVSRAIISGLESGKITSTTIKTLAKLASALDTTIDSLFFADSV